MLISDAGASLVRRWYLTLVGLLATASLVALALFLVQPSWQSTASVVLLPPRTSVPAGGQSTSSSVASRRPWISWSPRWTISRRVLLCSD